LSWFHGAMRDLYERAGFPHFSEDRRRHQVSLTTQPLTGAASCLSSLSLCGVVLRDRLVLLWVIGRLIREEAEDHADNFVADRNQGPLAGPFARGLVRALCIIGLDMGRRAS